MKYVKMLALAAVAASALMAFVGAGTASATRLCSTTVSSCPAGQVVTGTLIFSIPSGKSAKLTDTSGETTLDNCTGSEVKGPITNSGSSTATVSGTTETLSWSGCTFTTNTLVKGNLEIHQIAGTSNGTVTAAGSGGEFQVTINTGLFGSCIYGVTPSTDIGTLTEGNPATFHANAIAEKFTGSNFACPSTSKWTGTYVLTSPATTVSVSSS